MMTEGKFSTVEDKSTIISVAVSVVDASANFLLISVMVVSTFWDTASNRSITNPTFYEVRS